MVVRSAKVSIPQRSDLNYVKNPAQPLNDFSFNPATVWFEPSNTIRDSRESCRFQSRNGLIWTVLLRSCRCIVCWFQSRNGLIWTIRVWPDKLVWDRFQSRNGLIWTFDVADVEDMIIVSIPQRSDLNYTDKEARKQYKTVSIPQRSDLNQRGGERKPTYKRFQSRNGLIWTVFPSPYVALLHGFNPATVWFEQLIPNAAIYLLFSFNPATVWFEPLSSLLWRFWVVVSIPQRSDLNFLNSKRYRVTNNVSIPQRSDLNLTTRMPGLDSRLSFNPATVWFERIP